MAGPLVVVTDDRFGSSDEERQVLSRIDARLQVCDFQSAADAIDVTERDRELPIKYDLMLALIEASREEGDTEMAKMAKSICSEIARKDITYRDIRLKRKEVDEVIKELTGG